MLYRATLIDKDRADIKELYFKGNAWSHTDDGKDGCMSVATGEHRFTNLSAEQVKPLLPTLAILLEISFYLFFIMLQLCMPAQHDTDLRSLKILALKLKIEANHSRSQISSLQVTGSLPRKVLLFPRLIIIFPLRWINFLTENSITNRAKPIYSPTKFLCFHWEKKNYIFLPHTSPKAKYFWHVFHRKPTFFYWKYGCSPSGDVLVHWLPFPQGSLCKESIEKKSSHICIDSVFFPFPTLPQTTFTANPDSRQRTSLLFSPSKMQRCSLHTTRYHNGHDSYTRDQEAKANFPRTLP